MPAHQQSRRLASALLLALLLHVTPVHAETVPAERLGPVWPIVETDMRTVIMARLKAKLPELTGRLRTSLATYRAPSTPRPTTTTARTLYMDPSITLASDLVDHTGRVLAPAGRQINPLMLTPLRRTYLVLNAADPRQVDWGRSRLQAHPTALFTFLLTDGSLDQAKQAFPAGTRIFPAPPALFARFSIDSVPARISRSHDQVQVDLIADTELPASTQEPRP